MGSTDEFLTPSPPIFPKSAPPTHISGNSPNKDEDGKMMIANTNEKMKKIEKENDKNGR